MPLTDDIKGLLTLTARIDERVETICDGLQSLHIRVSELARMTEDHRLRLMALEGTRATWSGVLRWVLHVLTVMFVAFLCWKTGIKGP